MGAYDAYKGPLHTQTYAKPEKKEKKLQEIKVSDHLTFTTPTTSGGEWLFLNDDTRDSYIRLNAEDIEALAKVLPSLTQRKVVLDYTRFEDPPF